MVLLECRDGISHWFTDLETGTDLKVRVRSASGPFPERHYVVRRDESGDNRISRNFPTAEAADDYLFAVVRALAARVTVVFLEEVAEFENWEAPHAD